MYHDFRLQIMALEAIMNHITTGHETSNIQ